MVPPSQIKKRFQQLCLNNCFTTTAEKKRRKYQSLAQTFIYFLKNRHQNSFFLSPTNKSEIQNKISSLDSNKSIGPDYENVKVT